MPTDRPPALIPAESPAAAPSPVPAGPAAAAELIAWVRAELPHLADLGQREELLAAAWLISLRAARTRRAYAGDLRAWLAWLDQRGSMCSSRAGCTPTCGWPASLSRARRPRVCGGGCRRCPASTATAPPMTWWAGFLPLG